MTEKEETPDIESEPEVEDEYESDTTDEEELTEVEDETEPEEEEVPPTVAEDDEGEVGDEEETLITNDEGDDSLFKKKPSRRNKNSKVIDYKTFQTIAGGGISTNVDLGDEESETNLRKFENEISKDHIIDFHPEIKTHNYDEIATLATIVRNEQGQIIDNFHKTIPILSKYEKTRTLGVRARQLNYGADPMIEVPDNIIDGYTIATMEYEQKKLPFIIKRPLPNGTVEYWRFADLEQVNL